MKLKAERILQDLSVQNYTASTNFVQCFTFGDSIDVTLHIEDNEISVGEDKDNDIGSNVVIYWLDIEILHWGLVTDSETVT